MIKALCLISFLSIDFGHVHVNPEQVVYVFKTQKDTLIGRDKEYIVIKTTSGKYPDTTVRVDEPLDQVVEKLQKGCE